MTLAIGGYLVSGHLAQGASSQTMTVHNAARTVIAIGKRLIPRFRADPLARAQFDTEARVLRALAGRGAPRLLGSGEDGDGPWLVMEQLAMSSLSSVAVGGSSARSRAVARLAEACLHALATVHEAADAEGPLDMVHGDVSLDNLLVCEDPASARLIDFGLAHFRDAPVAPVGPIRGTLQYIAPEVARGEPATQSSDVFSLGLTLLHAASGEPPRAGAHLAALILEAAEEPVDAYAERASRELPIGIRDALFAAVAFDPRSRRKNAREAWRHSSW